MTVLLRRQEPRAKQRSVWYPGLLHAQEHELPYGDRQNVSSS